jgi:hypothetical protein
MATPTATARPPRRITGPPHRGGHITGARRACRGRRGGVCRACCPQPRPSPSRTRILCHRRYPAAAIGNCPFLSGGLTLAGTHPSPRRDIPAGQTGQLHGRARPCPKDDPIASPAHLTRRPNYGPLSPVRLDFLRTLQPTSTTGHQCVSPRSQRGHGALAAEGGGDARNEDLRIPARSAGPIGQWPQPRRPGVQHDTVPRRLHAQVPRTTRLAQPLEGAPRSQLALDGRRAWPGSAQPPSLYPRSMHTLGTAPAPARAPQLKRQSLWAPRTRTSLAWTLEEQRR